MARRVLSYAVLQEYQAVLQKHEEDHKGQSFTVLWLYLHNHSEQFCDKCSLPQALSFAHLFSHHI